MNRYDNMPSFSSHEAIMMFIVRDDDFTIILTLKCLQIASIFCARALASVDCAYHNSTYNHLLHKKPDRGVHSWIPKAKGSECSPAP